MEYWKRGLLPWENLATFGWVFGVSQGSLKKQNKQFPRGFFNHWVLSCHGSHAVIHVVRFMGDVFKSIQL